MVTAMACIPAVPREPKLQFVSHSGIVVSAGCGAKLGGEGEVAAPGCATCCPASSSEEAGQPVSRNAVYRMTTAQLQHTARLADQQHSVLEVVDLLSGLPSSGSAAASTCSTTLAYFTFLALRLGRGGLARPEIGAAAGALPSACPPSPRASTSMARADGPRTTEVRARCVCTQRAGPESARGESRGRRPIKRGREPAGGERLHGVGASRRGSAAACRARCASRWRSSLWTSRTR